MVMSTPRWTADDLPDLSGRTALVTGATSGIGRVTATELARHGARVILAVRNPRAGADLADELAGSASVLPVDLASLESVHRAAATVDEPIDLLVNNAGVMAPPRLRITEDGQELQFQTNHLGHFALTGLLLPRLLDAPAPRVTTVSSIAPRRGSRAEAAGVPLTSTAAHPGVSNTNLFASKDGIGGIPLLGLVSRPVMGLLFPDAAAGAEATLYAATVAPPGSYTGPTQLFGSRGPVGPAGMSETARDEQLADQLWSLSEDLTGVRFDLGGAA